MTQDEIINMAREAGLHKLIQHRFVVEKHYQELSPKLKKFACLIAEATKEKAAKVCKDYAEKCVEAENWEAEDVALHLDAAIRGMK